MASETAVIARYATVCADGRTFIINHQRTATEQFTRHRLTGVVDQDSFQTECGLSVIRLSVNTYRVLTDEGWIEALRR